MSAKNKDGRKEKGSSNENREPLSNADTRAGDKNRGVDKRGNALLRVGSVPGYNKGEGTPGWIAKAASRAEGLAKSHEFMGGVGCEGKQEIFAGHRIHPTDVGKPPYGKTAEVDPKQNTQGGGGKQAIKKGREGS